MASYRAEVSSGPDWHMIGCGAPSQRGARCPFEAARRVQHPEIQQMATLFLLPPPQNRLVGGAPARYRRFHKPSKTQKKKEKKGIKDKCG